VKILIAVDGSPLSNEAARVAERLFPNAEHILLSAASVAPFVIADPMGGGGIGVVPTQAAFAAAEDEADSAVIVAQAQMHTKATAETPLGSAGPVICEEAAALGVDVVVVGHGHKTWISRLFDPSVSDYVIRHATCPVLVVTEPH
jgi:nucleotide-binding universal stress UspA family protein